MQFPKVITLGLIAAIHFSTQSAAAIGSADFTGRWRADTASFSDIKPTVFMVSGGIFKKDNEEDIPSDGRFHPVSGQGGYIDETSISIESDRLVREVDRVRGRIVYTEDYIVSPDGQELTTRVTSYANASGQPSRSETVERRIDAAVPGVHPMSGRWRRVKLDVDATADWIIEANYRHFSRRTGTGSGYDAVLGHGPVPFEGDVSGARVLISRIRPEVVLERWMSAKGVFGAVLKMQLMPDGKSIRATAFGPDHKRSTIFYLRRVS